MGGNTAAHHMGGKSRMMDTDNSGEGRPFSLWLYLAVVFSVSWPFQLAMLFLARSWKSAMAFSCASMIMVGVGTFICGRYIFRDGFATAQWRWGKPVYYVAVIAFVAFLWVLPTAMDISAGSAEIPPGITTGSILITLSLMIPLLLPAAFGEEIGWRGYLLPRLARANTPRKAVLLHSLIWWVWHIPLVGVPILLEARDASLEFGIGPALTVPFMLLVGILAGTMQGVIFGFVWARSASLAVVTAYHVAYDAIRDSIVVNIVTGPLVEWWASLVICVVGALLLWKGDWRALAASMRADPNPELKSQEEG
ncbi:MAG: CPBP family intramembrane glutamic endopeptidase [Thermodesulfobacteriota bacterium]